MSDTEVVLPWLLTANLVRLFPTVDMDAVVPVNVRDECVNELRVHHLIDVCPGKQAMIYEWHDGKKIQSTGIPSMFARLTSKGFELAMGHVDGARP